MMVSSQKKQEEVNNVADEIETLSGDSEELEDVADGLESLANEVQVIVDRGESLSVESAAFIHHAVGAYLNRIGLTSDELIPSIEAFGDPVDPDDRNSGTKGIVHVIKDFCY